MQDPFYTKEKRKKSSGLLAADAWLDSSLYESGQSMGRFWTRFQDVMSVFHVAGFKRLVVEILSDGLSFFAIGCAGFAGL